MELDKGLFIDAISMNHPWFEVTCGPGQDRMTTEGKSAQLFSPNTALPSDCSNGNWEELCLSDSQWVIVALFHHYWRS